MNAVTKTRRCPICKEHLEHKCFRQSKGKPHGYCKPCAREKERQRHRDRVVDLFGSDELARRDAVRRKKANAVPGNKVCARCLVEKPLGDFYGKKNPDSYCKPCRGSIDRTLQTASPRKRLICLLGAARTRSRNNGWAYDLDIEDLVTLWEDQSGTCWYTGVDLVYDGNHSPEALSIDRVDSSKGYTRENVVLCCRRVNEMKREMPLVDLRMWCQRILEHTDRGNLK